MPNKVFLVSVIYIQIPSIKVIYNYNDTHRLDFVQFSIAQPDSESRCTDEFQVVGGNLNNVPVICGENNNGEQQHS